MNRKMQAVKIAKRCGAILCGIVMIFSTLAAFVLGFFQSTVLTERFYVGAVDAEYLAQLEGYILEDLTDGIYAYEGSEEAAERIARACLDSETVRACSEEYLRGLYRTLTEGKELEKVPYPVEKFDYYKNHIYEQAKQLEVDKESLEMLFLDTEVSADTRALLLEVLKSGELSDDAQKKLKRGMGINDDTLALLLAVLRGEKTDEESIGKLSGSMTLNETGLEVLLEGVEVNEETLQVLLDGLADVVTSDINSLNFNVVGMSSQSALELVHEKFFANSKIMGLIGIPVWIPVILLVASGVGLFFLTGDKDYVKKSYNVTASLWVSAALLFFPMILFKIYNLPARLVITASPVKSLLDSLLYHLIDGLVIPVSIFFGIVTAALVGLVVAMMIRYGKSFGAAKSESEEAPALEGASEPEALESAPEVEALPEPESVTEADETSDPESVSEVDETSETEKKSDEQ